MLNIKVCPYEPVLRIKSFYTAFEAIREVGFFFNGESHDSWEFVFIIEGHAGVSSEENVYKLEPGQVIIHPPCEFHRIWNDGNEDLKIVIISFKADAFPLTHHGIYQFSSTDRLYHVLKKLHSVFEISRGGIVTKTREEASAAGIQLAVNDLEKYVINLLCHGEEVLSPQRDKRSALYSLAMETMKENLAHRLSVSEIAETCGVSISTLQKLFRRFTGMGVAKSYESLVMEKARTMIEDGMRVKEAASELGFDDQNYFSTVYKRYFGLSPTKHSKG